MKVLADITLFLTEISGKTYRWYTGVRPHHQFKGLASWGIGQIDFVDAQWIDPGETKRAVVNFIDWEPMLQLFKVGFEWDIVEGNKVGRGKILELLHEN